MSKEMPMNIWATEFARKQKRWSSEEIFARTKYTNTDQLIERLEGLKTTLDTGYVCQFNRAIDQAIKIVRGGE